MNTPTLPLHPYFAITHQNIIVKVKSRFSTEIAAFCGPNDLSQADYQLQMEEDRWVHCLSTIL